MMTEDEFEGHMAFTKEKEPTLPSMGLLDWLVVIFVAMSLLANLYFYLYVGTLETKLKERDFTIESVEKLYQLK